MRTTPRLALCALLLSTALGLAACSDDDEEPEVRGVLTIYSSLPLQGDSEPQSADIVLAMRMALEDSGGDAAGYQISYVSLDDAGPEFGAPDPAFIEANARAAAADPNAIAYIGEFNSPATVVSLPILNEAGILQVSPANTHVGLTRSDGAPEGEPDVFYPTGERTFGRVVPADHVQAGALVSYMRDEECSNVFIMNDGEPFYGQSIADQVQRNAEDQGLEVLGNVSADLSADDFRDLGRQVRSAGADCTFFGGWTQNRAVDVTLDVAAANPGIKMFFPDGCAESAFTEGIPAELEPRVFITNPTLDPDDYPEQGQEFYEEFRAQHGRDPEPYAIYGYEAMSVVLDAIERAGEDAAPTAEGRQAVVDAFFETSDRDSVLGTYDIDPYGDTTLTSYGGFVIEGGGVTFGETIEVEVADPVDGPELTPAPEPEATVLEGTWRGGKVTQEMLAQVRSQKEAAFVFEANGAESTIRSTLEVRDNVWQMLVSIDGRADEPAQRGEFSIEGDRIEMTDEQGAHYTYAFDLRGDTLRIRLVDSDAGMAAPGISDDAFQVAHYFTPFRRLS